MLYYKDSKTSEVFSFSSEDARKKFGSKDLVVMTDEEIINHLNPKPTIDHLEEEARAKRYLLLSETDWVVTRHRDEVEEGVKTTLSPEEYSAMQAYRRDLRDITEQPGFPEVIDWPQKPE